MPIVFTKEEIKEFLIEQGYNVTDEETLKKFIHDLKKLIKYEERRKRRQHLGHGPDETILDTTTTDVTKTHLSTTTDSSNGAAAINHPHSVGIRGAPHAGPPRRPQTAGDNSQPRFDDPKFEGAHRHSKSSPERGREFNKNGAKALEPTRTAAKRPMTARTKNKAPVPVPTVMKDLKEESRRRRPVPTTGKKGEEECEEKAPDELFIALKELVFKNEDVYDSESNDVVPDNRQKKLLKPPPHVARDPVALFHWYKNYNWDIYTIPGENKHMQLRWNVRAYTVGGYHPCIERTVRGRRPLSR